MPASPLRCAFALPSSSPSQQFSLFASCLCVLCDTPSEDCTLDINPHVFKARHRNIQCSGTTDLPFTLVAVSVSALYFQVSLVLVLASLRSPLSFAPARGFVNMSARTSSGSVTILQNDLITDQASILAHSSLITLTCSRKNSAPSARRMSYRHHLVGATLVSYPLGGRIVGGCVTLPFSL